MPYEIIREPQGVYKRFWGVVTPAEFLASVHEFHNDTHFESIRYTINDFLATEHFLMPESAIEDVAAINLGATFVNQKIKIAAITTDSVIIGMARKFAEISQSYPVKMFTSLDEARAWVKAPG